MFAWGFFARDLRHCAPFFDDWTALVLCSQWSLILLLMSGYRGGVGMRTLARGRKATMVARRWVCCRLVFDSVPSGAAAEECRGSAPLMAWRWHPNPFLLMPGPCLT